MSDQQVALQIINFLKTAVADEKVSEDYVDSIDVAIDCLAEAFNVDKEDDQKTITSDFKGQNLKQILSAFQSKSASLDGVEVPVHVDEEENSKPEISEEVAKRATELKLLGNKAMANKDFEEAIARYTEALELSPNNVVFLSNRAAAFSSMRNHEEAVKDAKAAIEADPTYAKAYSRLGVASYALNKPKDALDAFKKGLEIEGDNASMKKGYETAKARVEEQLGLDDTSSATSGTPATREEPSSAGSGSTGLPDFSNLASMLGGGGAGGTPNFSDMLNNPQLMQYAQQMMQNPDALNNLMSNPAVKQMAEKFGLGGGANGSSGAARDSDATGSPDLSSLLNNPALADLAKGFFGGNKQ